MSTILDRYKNLSSGGKIITHISGYLSAVAGLIASFLYLFTPYLNDNYVTREEYKELGENTEIKFIVTKLNMEILLDENSMIELQEKVNEIDDKIIDNLDSPIDLKRKNRLIRSIGNLKDDITENKNTLNIYITK